jgi:hypothetical protein
MREFTVEEAHRWYEWEHANMLSAQRSHRLSVAVGALLLSASLVGVIVAVVMR